MQDFLQQFTFAQPWWLLGLPLLTPLLFLRGKQGTPTSITYSSLSILLSLGKKPSRLPGAIAFSLMILALVCAFIAMARPQLRDEQSQHKASGVDIILAIDISYSMQIVDFILNNRRAQRITVAKDTAQSFIGQRPHDRIGLVAFAGRPYVTSPITLEHDWLIEKLRELRPGLVREQGTAIGSAIAASASRLHERESKSKVVVLVTDGSNNSGRIAPRRGGQTSRCAWRQGLRHCHRHGTRPPHQPDPSATHNRNSIPRPCRKSPASQEGNTTGCGTPPYAARHLQLHRPA